MHFTTKSGTREKYFKFAPADWMELKNAPAAHMVNGGTTWAHHSGIPRVLCSSCPHTILVSSLTTMQRLNYSAACAIELTFLAEMNP
jgi:hypothetical protein